MSTVAPPPQESSDSAEVPELKVVTDATCTFCGCVCDDMELTVEGNKIKKAKNACVLGKAWFLNHHIEDRPEATIEGQPASYEQAIERAGTKAGHKGAEAAMALLEMINVLKKL